MCVLCVGLCVNVLLDLFVGQFVRDWVRFVYVCVWEEVSPVTLVTSVNPFNF